MAAILLKVAKFLHHNKGFHITSKISDSLARGGGQFHLRSAKVSQALETYTPLPAIATSSHGPQKLLGAHHIPRINISPPQFSHGLQRDF